MIELVRPAIPVDLPHVMHIYETARRFMQQTGNAKQWVDGYPRKELIIDDIAQNQSFVCENGKREIVGAFCFFADKEEPTYQKIYKGGWLNNEPYGVVHRLASSGTEKGVAETCIGWCFSQINNIRIDTHRDNLVMQCILQKLQFQYCGIIYLENGDERLAYQKMV